MAGPAERPAHAPRSCDGLSARLSPCREKRNYLARSAQAKALHARHDQMGVRPYGFPERHSNIGPKHLAKPHRASYRAAMTMPRLFQMSARSLLSALLWCALLGAVMSPSGFMADFTDGGFRIRICSGLAETPSADMSTPRHGAAMAGMEHGRQREHRNGDTPDMKPCAFAGVAAHLMMPPCDMALPLPVTATPSPLALASVRFAAHTLYLPPATGPPPPA